MEGREVDLRWLRKIEGGLYSGVHEDAVEVWVRLCDAEVDVRTSIDLWRGHNNLLAHKSIHALSIIDIKFGSARLVFAMLADKVVKSVLSATDCSDLGAFLDETICKASTNAGRSSDHENGFVLESHCEC